MSFSFGPDTPKKKKTNTSELEGINDRITWSELNTVIGNLKSWRSPGIDGIPYEYFKSAYEVDNNDNNPKSKFGKVLLKLANIMLINGIPNDWNKSGLIPVFKGGDSKDLNNYRGIALIKTIVKIVTIQNWK